MITEKNEKKNIFAYSKMTLLTSTRLLTKRLAFYIKNFIFHKMLNLGFRNFRPIFLKSVL